MASLIRCVVKYRNSSKVIFCETFDHLNSSIPEKFGFGPNLSFHLLDEYNCELDADAFLGFKSSSIPLILTVSLLDESTTCEETYDTLDYIIYSLERQEKYRIHFPHNIYLNELSDLIISDRGFEKSKFVCFFYSLDGQPLATSFYVSQFLKIRDVLSLDDKVYVIITKNIFSNQLIQKVTYERRVSVSAFHKKYNQTIDFKINLQHDKKDQIKDLIGLSFGFPSDLIYIEDNQLQNLTERSKIEFSLREIEKPLEFKLYNTTIPQTETGLRLLRSFMMCLPHHCAKDIKNRLIAWIRYIIPFNPFIYSLYHCLHQKSISESELISFNDGVYYLFSFLHGYYKLSISNESLLDHTLEFFAVLFELADVKSFKKYEEEKFDTKIISHLEKFREPVIVPLSNNQTEIYDMPKINELISNNQSINKLQGSIDNLQVDRDLRMIIKRTEGINRSELVVMMTKFDSSIEIRKLVSQGPNIRNLSDFESIKNKRCVTQITSYLELKTNSKRNTLTYNQENKIVINYGIKYCSSDVELKDEFTNKLTPIDPNDLASVFSTINSSTRSVSNSQVQEENFSRIPDEAIVVLLDTSGSMGNDFLDTEKTRLTIAKDFFNSFINKSLGYNLPQVISLTTFDSSVNKMSGFTENAFKFCEKLEKVTHKGNTSIFDAISQGINDLKEIKTKYNDIKIRIICFSDGEDNSSSISEIDVLKNLVNNKIVLDSINLGEKCISLKNISIMTGGFAFWCDTIEQGFKIFESDAFVSVNFREPWTSSATISTSDLKSNSFKQFTQIPPPFKKPNQIELQASSIASALVTMEIAKPKFQTTTGSLRFKRINREMALIYKNNHPDIQIYPCDTDIQFWNGIIKGPQGTLYEGGNFQIYISFPVEYPYKAPEIKFITQIFHLNINSSGRICISILNNDYGPEITILKLLQSIYGLLIQPEDADSLDTNVAILYRSSKPKYESIAREWTRSFATRSTSELLRGVNEREIKDGIPVEFLCNLTKKMMTNPVKCRTSELMYERSEIESYIKTYGCDPITKQPTSLKKLYHDETLRKTIERFNRFK